MKRLLTAVVLGLTFVGPAFPQTAAQAPDAATLASAKAVVTAMQGDRTAALAAMSGPLAGMVQQFGIREADRAQILVREVVIPTLSTHYDELLDIQARSYASALGKGDLDAVAAFYATPAGRNLAAAQPRLAATQVTGMTQWMAGLSGELQAKLTQSIQSHGWNK